MAAAATAPGAAISAPPASSTRAADSRTTLQRLMPFIAIGLAFAFPIIDQALGLGMMNPMLRILTSVMLAMGLNIVVGFAGLLDLGYVAFWAIGAYCVGWLASGQFANLNLHLLSGLPHDLPGVHLSIWMIFPIAAVVTALFGVALGAPTLRLRGDYLAIVTLGFGEIIPNLFRNGDDVFGGHNLTNGTAGISGLDTPQLGPAGDALLGPGWSMWGPLNLWPWYYLALTLCALCWYVSATVQWSRMGRAWMAIREDETAASAMGIDCVNAKLWAYGIGASLGGVAGVFHGARIGSVFPSSFMFYVSISVLCMVIIGGMGNVYGAIAGAFVVEGLNFWLLPSLTKWGNAMGLSIDFSSWNMLIFGVLLVLVMLYRPQGIFPSKSRQLNFDDVPEQPGVQHFPAGMAGPQGTDPQHQLEPGPPMGDQHHALPVAPPAAHGEQVAAAFTGQHSQPPAPVVVPPFPAPGARRFSSRFGHAANPFGGAAAADGGAPA